MVLAARYAVKARDSRLRRFYLRVKAGKGNKVAIVALARKMLTIIHHRLFNVEKYMGDGFENRLRPGRLVHFKGVSLEEMAEVLRDAEFVVTDPFG